MEKLTDSSQFMCNAATSTLVTTFPIFFEDSVCASCLDNAVRVGAFELLGFADDVVGVADSSGATAGPRLPDADDVVDDEVDDTAEPNGVPEDKTDAGGILNLVFASSKTAGQSFN